MSSTPGPQGSMILLWAGEDPALHSALIEGLRSAGIPFFDKPAGGEQLTPKVDIFRVNLGAQFGFEVSVLTSNLTVAEEILEKLLDEEPVDVELLANDSPGTEASGSKPSGLGATTCAVWADADEVRAGFLVQALKENEIPARVETQGSKATVYVPQEEEMLAREIIREIVEGAPPA